MSCARRTFLALPLAALAQVPDPLRMPNGDRVTAETWRNKRRSEILNLFREHVYGFSPPRPENQTCKVVEEDGQSLSGTAIRREIDVTIRRQSSQFTMRLTVYLPKAARKPSPAFLLLNHRGTLASQTGKPFFPAAHIVERGYAAAGITLGQLSPDDPAHYRDGIIGFYDGPRERAPNSWRTLAAWAWGGSRAMDYLETDEDIDAQRVAVIGHSRSGKTALWCGTQDERFALSISNDSGEGGAALARRRLGERTADLNRVFPYWYNANFKQYSNHEENLPVDQHELIALLAPRLAYVASAEKDAWSDPPGEFEACLLASPVYELLGTKGVAASAQPPVDHPVLDGHIGYHVRQGGHDLLEYDWDQFMNFADLHWNRHPGR